MVRRRIFGCCFSRAGIDVCRLQTSNLASEEIADHASELRERAAMAVALQRQDDASVNSEFLAVTSIKDHLTKVNIHKHKYDEKQIFY